MASGHLAAYLPNGIMHHEFFLCSPTRPFFRGDHIHTTTPQQSHVDLRSKSSPQLSVPNLSPEVRLCHLGLCPGAVALRNVLVVLRKRAGRMTDCLMVFNTSRQGILSREIIRISWRIMPVSVIRPALFLLELLHISHSHRPRAQSQAAQVHFRASVKQPQPPPSQVPPQSQTAPADAPDKTHKTDTSDSIPVFRYKNALES